MLLLYSGPLSMFGAKAQIAAREKGVEHRVEMVPFSLRDFYSPKHPEVARINPKAQVPVLVDGDLEIFDSTQIFEYLETIAPEPALWPADPQARARVRLWELKSDEVFFAQAIILMGHVMNPGHPDAQAAIAAMQDYYDTLNRHLEGRDYIGAGYSYADIAFYMAQFFAAFLGAPTGPAHSAINDWRARVGARDAVRAVIKPMQAVLAENGLTVPDAA